jgi:hypothetical protein
MKSALEDGGVEFTEGRAGVRLTWPRNALRVAQSVAPIGAAGRSKPPLSGRRVNEPQLRGFAPAITIDGQGAGEMGLTTPGLPQELAKRAAR